MNNTTKVNTTMSLSTKSSRTNSWSSVSSASSIPKSRHDPCNLELRATNILTTLFSDPANTSIHGLIAPTIRVEHGDESPTYSVESYLSRFSNAIARYPNLSFDVKEACADEMQMKVWVRSEISGLPRGMVKESIDMLYFDEHGMLVGSVDHQKIKRRW